MSLDTTFLCHDFDLMSIVDALTHGNNVFDQVIVNRLGVYKSLADFFTRLKSQVKTKHKAVLLIDKLTSNCNVASSNCNAASKKVKVKMYDLHSTILID